MNLFSEISNSFTPGMERVCYIHRSQPTSVNLGQVSTSIVLKTSWTEFQILFPDVFFLYFAYFLILELDKHPPHPQYTTTKPNVKYVKGRLEALVPYLRQKERREKTPLDISRGNQVGQGHSDRWGSHGVHYTKDTRSACRNSSSVSSKRGIFIILKGVGGIRNSSTGLLCCHLFFINI